MGMQAWQKRESEQQDFVEELQHEVYERADEEEDADLFLTEIGAAILGHIIATRRKNGLPQTEAGKFIAGLYEKIIEFARVESERPYLLTLLWKQLETSIFALASRPYADEQMRNPQAVYGAASPTAEVEAPKPRRG